jgi:hypothetical protein
MAITEVETVLTGNIVVIIGIGIARPNLTAGNCIS